MERHKEAARAEQRGDSGKAIALYEASIAKGFVGSHLYERLASLCERRHDYEEASRACATFVRLVASGTLPRGAQRSACRKLPAFLARIERYRRLLQGRRSRSSPLPDTYPNASRNRPKQAVFTAINSRYPRRNEFTKSYKKQFVTA